MTLAPTHAETFSLQKFLNVTVNSLCWASNPKPPAYQESILTVDHTEVPEFTATSNVELSSLV